jgi:hypothetical protein
MLHSDPPDFKLSLNEQTLGIEVTEFPPDQASVNEMQEWLKASTDFEDFLVPNIWQHWNSYNLIEPGGRSPTMDEYAALRSMLAARIQMKDDPKNDILLLYHQIPQYGTLQAEMPSKKPSHLKAVYHVTGSGTSLMWTALERPQGATTKFNDYYQAFFTKIPVDI